MELADDGVGALLPVGGKIDVDQVVAVQAQVTYLLRYRRGKRTHE